MAVQITPKPDDCAKRMVSNPAGYFNDACERLRAEVVEDLIRDRRRSL